MRFARRHGQLADTDCIIEARFRAASLHIPFLSEQLRFHRTASSRLPRTPIG